MNNFQSQIWDYADAEGNLKKKQQQSDTCLISFGSYIWGIGAKCQEVRFFIFYLGV